MRRALLLGALTFYPLMASAAMAANQFSPEQTAEIQTIVQEYLVANPTILEDAQSALNAKREADEMVRVSSIVENNHKAIFESPTSPVLGNPNGDVTVVEFLDYNCGYCKASFPIIEGLIESDPGVRVVIKELPILSATSDAAAKAALSAAKQGKYKEYHAALFALTNQPDLPALLDIAKATGLDVNKWKADLADPAVAAEIEANHALIRPLGIRGTPAFIVGNQLFPGAVDGEMLKTAVAKARAANAAKVQPAKAE